MFRKPTPIRTAGRAEADRDRREIPSQVPTTDDGRRLEEPPLASRISPRRHAAPARPRLRRRGGGGARSPPPRRAPVALPADAGDGRPDRRGRRVRLARLGTLAGAGGGIA